MTCKNCERLEKDCKKVVGEWRVIVKKLQKECLYLQKLLHDSHHLCCNYPSKRVGDCNCEAVMKAELRKSKEYFEGDGRCPKCDTLLMPPSCPKCDFKRPSVEEVVKIISEKGDVTISITEDKPMRVTINAKDLAQAICEKWGRG